MEDDPVTADMSTGPRVPTRISQMATFTTVPSRARAIKSEWFAAPPGDSDAHPGLGTRDQLIPIMDNERWTCGCCAACFSSGWEAESARALDRHTDGPPLRQCAASRRAGERGSPFQHPAPFALRGTWALLSHGFCALCTV